MEKHDVIVNNGRRLGTGPPSDDPSYTIQVGTFNSNVGIVATTQNIPGIGEVPVFEIFSCTGLLNDGNTEVWRKPLGRVIESIFVPEGEPAKKQESKDGFSGYFGDSRQDKT